MNKTKLRYKRILQIVFLIIMLNSALNVSAQLSKNQETSQFNFWIGKWDLYANGSKFGESKADTLLDGFAIQEDFLEFPPEPFHSINTTTYNSEAKQWEQTMVDNMGHHSFFAGDFKDGKITLIRSFKNKNGEDRMQRVSFYNISSGSFDWAFDASNDGGKTWNTFYTVHYVRKK